MLWFKLKYKVKIKLQKYCERKRNTAKMKYSKRMDNALTLFWRKTSDRKRDTPDRKLLLSALEETIGPFIRGKIRPVLNKTRAVPFIRACLI